MAITLILLVSLIVGALNRAYYLFARDQRRIPPSERRQLAPFPVKEGAMVPVNKEGEDRWPPIAYWSDFHKVDLSTMEGRPVADRPLRDLTIFLNPMYGGDDLGPVVYVDAQGGIHEESAPPALDSTSASSSKSTSSAGEDANASSPNINPSSQDPTSSQMSAPSRSERKPYTPVIGKDITLRIAQETKVNLEKLGAKVILLRESDLTISDSQRAAAIAYTICDRFDRELASESFYHPELQSLLARLGKTIAPVYKSHPDFNHLLQGAVTEKDEAIFVPYGCPPTLKMILDLQSQFQDCLVINIGLNANFAHPDRAGCEVAYLADDELLRQIAEENPPAYPIWTGFPEESRHHLAVLLLQTTTGLLPNLLPPKDMLLPRATKSPLERWTSLLSVDFRPAYLTHARDLQIVQSDDQNKVLAQAIANAIYAYYCSSDQPSQETEPSS